MLSGMIGNMILVAAGIINTTGAVLGRTGSFTPSRTGAGVFIITLGVPGVPQTECLKFLTSHTAGVDCNSFIDTSDTIKTANFATNGGVATDAIFSFQIWQLVPGA